MGRQRGAPAERFHQPRHDQGPLASDGRSRLRLVDRLRERRQLASRSGHRPSQRSSASDFPRRKAMASAFPALNRKPRMAFIGGVLGVALASVMLKVILAILPPFSIPTEADIRVNVSVLVFTLAATGLAGVLCGCAPAWQGSHVNLNDTLKEGGRSSSESGRHGLRRGLVVMEFALALTLLAGAGLLIHSFWKLTRVDLGFRQDHLLTFSLPVRHGRFANSGQIAVFYRELLAKIAALPGSSSASASTGMPILGTSSGVPFSIPGQPFKDPSSRPSAGFTMVTPAYFTTFGIQITQGRSFTEQDAAGGLPVAIVNETFAKEYLPHVDPLAQG